MMALAAAVLTAELLHFQPQSTRANGIMAALEHAAKPAGVQATLTRSYQSTSDLLFMWGPGDPSRFEPMRRHVASGRRVIALDLAYWDRDKKFRVSIDAPHPQAWVMKRNWPDARLVADKVAIDSLWNPNGPVIVAGIGEKAGVQYGKDAVRAWEAQMIRRAQEAGRKVIYRPKKSDSPVHHNVLTHRMGSIDQALKGASLVVTWHSNVAVDAIRLGIPAICKDGAAAAVCPSEWADGLQPLDEASRRQFIANIAWFQWSPNEAKQMWAWLLETLS